jgi:anti-anti-sigma factor
MLESKYDLEANALTLVISGRMDSVQSATLAPLVEKELKKHTEQPPAADKPLKIIFDLQAVDFISSAFIRICMVTAAALKSGKLILQNANPFIKKTIKISGLENYLTIL